jgi:hypothetical protein
MLTALLTGLAYVVAAGMVYYGVKGAWELLKIAFRIAKWVIKGIFTMLGAGLEYITSTISELFEPEEIYILPPSQVEGLGGYVQQQINLGNVSTDPEVLEIPRKCVDAARNGEILMVAQGRNHKGEKVLAEPTFVNAEDYEDVIKQAGSRNQIYVKRVKV